MISHATLISFSFFFYYLIAESFRLNRLSLYQYFQHGSIKFIDSELQIHKTIPETLHYIHGWQYLNNNPELPSFRQDNNDILDYEEKLLELGYAINKLSWHEHAIDKEVKTIQDRLWLGFNEVNSQHHHSKNVIDLLQEQYLDKAKQNLMQKNRLIGHSLGAQAALLLATRIINQYPYNTELWPTRIALLDPAFIKGRYPIYHNKNSLELSLNLIFSLKRETNISFECYRSSLLTNNPFFGLPNSKLRETMSFLDLDSYYIPFFDLPRKHGEAKNFYFRSFFESPRLEKDGEAQHALTSDLETTANSNSYFKQINNAMSSHPNKMIFKKSRSS